MSVRNLEHLLKPKSVALIGASNTPGSVGEVVARNLFKSGFEGPVMPVNPRHRAVQGVLAYPDVESLPVTPDLGVIATPPPTVPGLVESLGARGTKAAVVITAGFGEGGGEAGRKLRQQALDAAQPHCLRIMGPNCLGVIVPGLGLNASFAHMTPKKGDLAFVSQSGAVMAGVMDWAASHGIGFSHLISLGDMLDVDFGDILDYLAVDMGTRAILLYSEAITHARKFMSAARASARAKPVVVVKTGRHAAAAKAAKSHTGALAGSDEVYEAVFNRAGMLRVLDLDELFDSVATLALARPPAGNRLAILTNGGGFGVLAADALIDAGGQIAELADETVEKLDGVLPPTWSRGNPVDIIGDAPARRYAEALEILLDAPGIDGLLVLNCPTAMTSSTEAARAVIETLGSRRATVFTSWLGEEAAEPGRRLFAEAGIPTYNTPGQAVRAFMYMVDYRRNQQLLMETPPAAPAGVERDTGKAAEVIAKALAAGREWLSEPESKAVLAAYGIPTVATHEAGDPRAAAARAAEIGGPVALKILSPDITHKSDVGGVALDLAGPDMVRQAAEGMLRRVSESHPEAEIEGFSVQPMVQRPGAFELIVGIVGDEQFGPVILFGQGGTAVEVVGDTALGLPPLNMKLARDLIERTAISKQLRGFRGLAPVDLDAVALTLVRVSQLIIDLAEVAELDINPLLADAYGVMALDARIRVQKSEYESREAAARRFAIRPYPADLEEPIELSDGTPALLRPVRPEDEPGFHAGFAKLKPDDIRMRFFAHMKTLPHPLAARLTQIDYDREMALVAVGVDERGREPEGGPDVLGVVRLAADPDNHRAEYAVIVRSDVQHRGLGHLLMQRIIDYARNKGIHEIFGHVLEDNKSMLQLCEELGFTVTRVPDEPGVMRVSLVLGEEPAPARAPAAGG